jgi:hypothetical protein
MKGKEQTSKDPGYLRKKIRGVGTMRVGQEWG